MRKILTRRVNSGHIFFK